ncbi:MAG: DNA primase [Lachnospiraceae bacterium]|nr:DNA primase [Lachnospiraceae bacterium]
MFYQRDTVEEVRQANDILSLVSSYVNLKKKGSSYFGLCPFHSEKSPSFSVRPERGMYHCFGCGKSGDVISFVMEYENYSFNEAVSFLADRAGIRLPEAKDSEEDKKKRSRREKLLAVNKEAGKYYYYALREPSGERGLNYLKNRGLTDDTMKAFGLGFARTGTNSLYRYLKGKGFDDGILSDSGIFNKDEKRGMTDKFWNRVIFPIMDIQNRIIGFGGRVMGDGEPKYLNSPETEIFDKGRNLYGLNFARKSRKKELIICEGYIDVITQHQAGFNQAVASLGTAFTPGQARLLGRYADEVLICYDSDGPGVKASIRVIGILREAGINSRVINLEPYKDPDELIRNLGAGEYQKRIDGAENSLYFEIRMEERGFDLKDPGSKTDFFKEVAKKLVRFEDALERDNYIEGISGKYGIKAESLSELVKKQAMIGESITVPDRPKPLKNEAAKEDNSIMAQKNLLTWMTDEPGIYEKAKKYITAEDFREGIYRTAAEGLFLQLEGGILNPAAILDAYQDESERSEIASVFNSDFSFELEEKDKEKTLKELILKVLEDSVNSLMREGVSDIRDMQLAVEKRRRLENIKKIFEKQDP